jgi:hypothetical protein
MDRAVRPQESSREKKQETGGSLVLMRRQKNDVSPFSFSVLLKPRWSFLALMGELPASFRRVFALPDGAEGSRRKSRFTVVFVRSLGEKERKKERFHLR